ncbi:MAG: shikimate dehydrogenase [Prevotellaceae bacterium]|jgi:shikimate dehydrogenase|nr:shikimate dehydrogenase [Prevotellaceae bacterium]
MSACFGIIGCPLGHSFSKQFFTQKFEREKIDAQYDLFELSDISQFPDFINRHTLSGLNVTIPYKEKIIAYLDETDETADAVKAVNVIKFIRKNGKTILKGYNTDVVGFERSIKPFLNQHHKKALILGTGGASKAVDFVLNKAGIETKFVSRTARENVLTYKMLDETIIRNHLVIVNASPVGTSPNTDESPDIPYRFLSDRHLLFDLVYNPAETLFLKKGNEQNATIVNGKEMHSGQANAAWEIWNDDRVAHETF